MKKLLYVVLLVGMLAFSATSVLAIEGEGTAEAPFIITDQGELELVTDFPDCHFVLANDIELEGTWIPLCKQTSSGYFSGVFDGAGYTISNLLTDGSEGGLFKDNKGTIKNLNIVINDDGMTGSGAVARLNSGTILNCVAKGNISYNLGMVGGICAENSNIIEQCKFEGNIENTYSSGYAGGICGYNSDRSYNTYSSVAKCVVIGNVTGKYYTGGICGYNSDKISDCYFIGNINSSSSYKGGIAGELNGYSNDYYSKVTDCYAVPTFNSNGYGVAWRNYSAVITTSYYDKTVSGLSDTSTGTPKSTAAMKMKQTYAKDWDFETIWGIDKNINNGYPYLLWEYPDVEEESAYTVNSVKLTDLSGNELDEMPTESFYFEINVTKNDNSKNSDTLIIAVYDENDALTDLKYMSGMYNQNQTMNFGAMINPTDKNIGNIKAFVWNSVSGMTPLSNSLEIR